METEIEKQKLPSWALPLAVASAGLILTLILIVLSFALGFFIGNGVYQGGLP